jgi:hypothetical protein
MDSPGNSQARAAASALLDFLHSYNWQASSRDAGSSAHDIPRGGLKINIGLYPPVTFVTPPGMKDFMAHVTKQRNELQEEADQRHTEVTQEVLKHMSKEEASKFEVMEREYQRAVKRIEKEYMGPCPTLASISAALGR